MSLIDNFKVAVLSLDIADGDKTLNINKVKELADQVPEGTDLLVVPELFSTGYIKDPEIARTLAEDDEGETISALKALSHAKRFAICGSYLSIKNDKLYNRGFFIEPNGDAAYYDKRHLFCLSEESKVCTQGTKRPPVVRYRGWNISFAVCYDLRFPVWLRNVGNRYDVMVIPANWPDKRQYAWQQLLIARAIENESYVIGANRSGEDQYGTYTGLSRVYDYMGKETCQVNGELLFAVLSKPALTKYREHFPFWKDAEKFNIAY